MKLVINIIAGRQTIQDPSANCGTAGLHSKLAAGKELRRSLTSYTQAVSTHNSTVSLHLLWIRRFSTPAGCANTTLQPASSQAKLSAADCAERVLAVCSAHSPSGNFPLSSKLNACRMQKPNRGNNQLKELFCDLEL